MYEGVATNNANLHKDKATARPVKGKRTLDLSTCSLVIRKFSFLPCSVATS